MTDRTEDQLIEQLAAMLREPPDDELARALDEPLEPELRDRLFELMEAHRVVAPTPMPAANDSGRRRWWGIGGAIAAAAAAVILIVLELGPEEAPQVEIAVAPRSVPEYGFHMDGGRATERGDTEPSEGKPQYPPNLRFTWTLQPKDQKVDWGVDVRMCAKSASGKEVDIDVSPFLEVGETGAVLLRGPVSALGLSPGDWTIKVAIGDPAVLASISNNMFDSICRATTAAGIEVRERDIEVLDD